MKVKMLCNTHYGKLLKKGQEIEVDEQTAKRWIARKIAVAVGGDEEWQATAQSSTQNSTSPDASTLAPGSKRPVRTKKKPSSKQQEQ